MPRRRSPWPCRPRGRVSADPPRPPRLPMAKTTDDMRAFWERRYAEARLYGTAPTSVATRLAAIFHRERVETLLEAGCGSGRDLRHYAREGFQVTGVDISSHALAWARRDTEAEGLAVALLRADLAEDPLDLGPFDAVVAIHLVHLHAAPLRQALVNRFWQLTRDGGLVAMANYSTSETGFTTWQPWIERNTRLDPRGKLVHFFDEDELEELLPPDRFEALTREEIDLGETPDSGPVVH